MESKRRLPERIVHEIRLLIFDLGNVVFNFSYANAFYSLARVTQVPVEVLQSKFSFDKQFQAHERGEITLDTYRKHLCKMLEIKISLKDFVTVWNSIFLDETRGMQKLLAGLSRTHEIVALSNINKTHAAFVREQFGHLLSLFSKVYFSNEIGIRKPDEAAYFYVLKEHGIAPHQGIFLDDSIENILSAQKIGLNTIHVKTPSSVKAGLKKYGVDVNK